MMKRLRILAAAPLLAGLAMFPGSAASAGTSHASYEFHVADDLLEDAVGSPPYAIAIAGNGDTIAVDGSGEFNAATKTASGSGRLIHTVAATGDVETGTWVATRLVSFQFYGCATEGLPENFCGGLAKVNVIATPDAAPTLHFPATLWIDCLIGNKIPPSGSEGIRLNVKNFINFNKTEDSGFTLFVRQ